MEIQTKFKLMPEHEWTSSTVYLLFTENMMYPERHTTNGRTDTSSRE
jgi:hypothetical protein